MSRKEDVIAHYTTITEAHFTNNTADSYGTNFTVKNNTTGLVEIKIDKLCGSTKDMRPDCASHDQPVTQTAETEKIQENVTHETHEDKPESKNKGHYKNSLIRKKRTRPGIFHPHPALAALPLRIIADDEFYPADYSDISTTPVPIIKENLQATAPQVFPEFTPLPRLPPGYLARYNVSTDTNTRNQNNKDTIPKKQKDEVSDHGSSDIKHKPHSFQSDVTDNKFLPYGTNIQSDFDNIPVLHPSSNFNLNHDVIDKGPQPFHLKSQQEGNEREQSDDKFTPFQINKQNFNDPEPSNISHDDSLNPSQYTKQSNILKSEQSSRYDGTLTPHNSTSDLADHSQIAPDKISLKKYNQEEHSEDEYEQSKLNNFNKTDPDTIPSKILKPYKIHNHGEDDYEDIEISTEHTKDQSIVQDESQEENSDKNDERLHDKILKDPFNKYHSYNPGKNSFNNNNIKISSTDNSKDDYTKDMPLSYNDKEDEDIDSSQRPKSQTNDNESENNYDESNDDIKPEKNSYTNYQNPEHDGGEKRRTYNFYPTQNTPTPAKELFFSSTPKSDSNYNDYNHYDEAPQDQEVRKKTDLNSKDNFKQQDFKPTLADERSEYGYYAKNATDKQDYQKEKSYKNSDLQSQSDSREALDSKEDMEEEVEDERDSNNNTVQLNQIVLDEASSKTDKPEINDKDEFDEDVDIPKYYNLDPEYYSVIVDATPTIASEKYEDEEKIYGNEDSHTKNRHFHDRTDINIPLKSKRIIKNSSVTANNEQHLLNIHSHDNLKDRSDENLKDRTDDTLLEQNTPKSQNKHNLNLSGERRFKTFDQSENFNIDPEIYQNSQPTPHREKYYQRDEEAKNRHTKLPNIKLQDNVQENLNSTQITDFGGEMIQAEVKSTPDVLYETYHPLQTSEEYPVKLSRISQKNYRKKEDNQRPKISYETYHPHKMSQYLEKNTFTEKGNNEYNSIKPKKNTNQQPGPTVEGTEQDSKKDKEILYETFHPHTANKKYRKYDPDISSVEDFNHAVWDKIPNAFEIFKAPIKPKTVPSFLPPYKPKDISRETFALNTDRPKFYVPNHITYDHTNFKSNLKPTKPIKNLTENNKKVSQLPDLTKNTQEGNVKQQYEKIPLDYMHDEQKSKINKNTKNSQQIHIEVVDSGEKEDKPKQLSLALESNSEEDKFGNLNLPEINLPESVIGNYDSTEHDEGTANIRKEKIQEETETGVASDEDDDVDGDDKDDENDEYHDENHQDNIDQRKKNSQNFKEEDDELYGKFFNDNEDLYESFVRDNFKNKGSFSERSQKIIMDPSVKNTMQDIFQHVRSNSKKTVKSKDPKYGYMWTLNYGRE